MNTRRFLCVPMLCTFAMMGCAAETDPSQDNDESEELAPAKQAEEQKVPVVQEGKAELTAKKKHCHVLSQADWWVVTGQNSEYGGTYCH